MVGPCLHTLPACPACTPCLHAGSCPLSQHGEQVPCGQGSHRRRCYPTAGCVAGQATASRAAQPPPLPITRPWCHAPPRPPARPQQLPPPAAPMRACRLSAQPIPLAVPLPVAPWWSPRFPRRRDCACSLRGCATAVVPVAVPRCRSFGKADPSPRCLARGGASVFGTLGARLTPPPRLQTPCGHGHGAPHHRCQGSAGHRHRCTHPSHPRTAALHPCSQCGWVMPGRQEDWGRGRSGVSGQLSVQAGCPSTPSPPPLPPLPPPAERDAW